MIFSAADVHDFLRLIVGFGCSMLLASLICIVLISLNADFSKVYALIGRMLGKNLKSTPASVIVDQMKEPRPLPLGRQEFLDWSDRIISGALLPGVDVESQRFALANTLLHLGPTESHKPDAHFIHTLRKVAINQVAHAMAQENRAIVKAREDKELAEKKAQDAQTEEPKKVVELVQ